MPEGNGTGRLDRIEANLETVGKRLNKMARQMHQMMDHHNAEFKSLMTWQVLMQEKMDRFDAAREADRQRAEAERKRLDELNATTDKRIEVLVTAIGELVKRLPIPAQEPAQ